MNFKVNSKQTAEDEGIVYILAIDLEDKTLIKVGVTARSKVDDRLAEILLGIWKKYRYVPHTHVKRFKKTTNIFEKEAILHKHFEEYKYETLHKFGGSTEFFHVELDKVVEVYDKLLAGKELDEVASAEESKV